MKKLISLMTGVALIGGIITGGLAKPVQAVNKYFNNLTAVNDTKKNMTFKISDNMKLVSDNTNFIKVYRITGATENDNIIISFTNYTLFSQDDLISRPYLATFIPGDSLDKWVTSLINGVNNYSAIKKTSKIIEKQSNLYVVDTWFKGSESYEFYKISNGVPLSMEVSTSGSYEKDFTNIKNEARSLFGSFNSIKSYSQNPNIYFYVIVLGTYKNKASADKAVIAAKAKGISTYISGENGNYKVNAASFRIKANAEREQSRLKTLGLNSSLEYRLSK